MAASTALQIVDLPNEILTSILSTFNTTSLLPLSLVSHHFHDLIRRITHQRLLEAAKVEDHKIIFECYHPASKFTSPYLFCEYLDIQTNAKVQSQKDLENKPELDISFADLYSNFLPLKPYVEPRALRSHPAGGPAPTPIVSNARVDKHNDFVCQNVNLDSYELFSQLCTAANLVKAGPKRGLFKSSSKIAEGTARIWRHWLAEQAANDNPEILWTDARNTIGLKMRVYERTDLPVAAPVMRSRNDDDPAVGYTMVLEALVIRTTKLLLMLEQSIEDEGKRSGKAIVIGSIWDT